MKKLFVCLLLMSTSAIFSGCEQIHLPNKETNESVEQQGENKAMTRTLDDGTVITEIREGNKITTIRKTPDNETKKYVEEMLDDGTKSIIDYDENDNFVRKRIIKNLGEGKTQTFIERKINNGSIKKAEEIEEHLSEGRRKKTRKYDDGRVLVMISKGNISEDTMTYPDGRVEKSTKKTFHKPNGDTKIIITKPDGTEEVRVFPKNLKNVK